MSADQLRKDLPPRVAGICSAASIVLAMMDLPDATIESVRKSHAVAGLRRELKAFDRWIKRAVEIDQQVTEAERRALFDAPSPIAVSDDKDLQP